MLSLCLVYMGFSDGSESLDHVIAVSDSLCPLLDGTRKLSLLDLKGLALIIAVKTLLS